MSLRFSKIILFLSLIFLSVFCGCGEPSFTDEGERYIKETRNKNSCYEISSGVREDAENDSFGNQTHKKYINISITGCDSCLSYDNVDSCDEVIYSIARKLYETCKNKNEFDGIALKISTFSDSSFNKFYVFEYNTKTQSLYLKDKYSYEPLLGHHSS